MSKDNMVKRLYFCSARCPLFKKRIEIIDSETIWVGMSGYLKIKEAKLVEK